MESHLSKCDTVCFLQKACSSLFLLVGITQLKNTDLWVDFKQDIGWDAKILGY